MWNFKRLLNCDTVFADWTDEGKVFQRIIERGIKLDRLDILLTAGTGYGSLRNWYAEVDDGDGIREDKYEGGQVFPHFVKKYQSVKVKPLLERWQTCWLRQQNDSWRWISLATGPPLHTGQAYSMMGITAPT